MPDKITSLAGLKKAIEGAKLPDKNTANRMWNAGLQKALDLINSFEAGLWELHDLGLADAETIKLVLGEPSELKKILEGTAAGGGEDD